MSFVQIVKPRLGTVDGLGWCLRFTQTVFSAPVKYPSAREAWDHQAGRHVGEPPPEGVIVPVWFDHTGAYGTPPVRKNWGHVAVSLGDGRYLTSPMNILQGGQAIYPSLLALMRALGGNPRYLGWSESMNGKHVVRKVVADQPASTPQSPNGDTVTTYRNTQDEVRKIKAGETLWLTHKSGPNKGKQQNCVSSGASGRAILTAHVYGDGFGAGDVLEITYVWQDIKTGKLSAHYVERVSADRHGMIRANPTFQRDTAAGNRVFLKVYAGSKNTKAGTLARLESDSSVLTKTN